MDGGKKSIAERIVYGALDVMTEKRVKAIRSRCSSKALDNVTPVVEVKSRRVGGATYQVPVEVRSARQHGAGHALAGRLRRAQARREVHGAAPRRRTDGRLPRVAARAVKKREDTHRMAEANKAFSHYRW